jgi:hypothetical protein
LAALNVVLAMLATAIFALASAIVHVLALAASKIINFLGEDLGIAAYLGRSFLAMTWATTGLLLASFVLGVVLFSLDKRWVDKMPREKYGAGRGQQIPMERPPSPAASSHISSPERSYGGSYSKSRF